PAVEDDGGVMVHRVPRPYTFFSARKARALMREVDIVHGHGICAYGLLRGRRRRRPPTVVKLHNVWAQELDVYRRLEGAASWLYVNVSMPRYVTMDRRTCERADRLISISEYLIRGVEGYGIGREKVDLIRNGVDVERFANAEPADVDLPRPIVAYIGRLARHKGVDALVRACADAGAGSLLVVGGGPSEAAMRAEADRLGVRSRFVGVVPHDDVPGYYLAADIVAYPSRYEPLGNVVLEGMAAGKPVVARRTGGIPEILPREAGRTFVKDVDMTERLRELLEDEALRRRLGEAGRRIAGGRSWADVARETTDVLKKVLDTTGEGT
ncbi:MAG: glycosyltransferase family 4 protein, partial [Thermoplasmata archaeon]|nr:glycosyltransferase family 4 protein [Thermoplasmata archaeon]